MNSPPNPDAHAPVLREMGALWQLAWPILVGQLASVGMAVADVAMAGHVSAQDLAGVSLGAAIWMIVLVTLMGVMMSVNPLVAHHVGAGELHRVAPLVRQALWKALGVGLVALILANACTLVLDAMALEPAVHTLATRFVHTTSLGFPAFAAYRVLYGYSTSLNQTKPLMVIALLALALNVLLNWLLIFGHAGLPRLGGWGCAWSTLVCVWFNLGALLVWMRHSDAYRSTWPLATWEGPRWVQIQSLLRLGLPIGVTYFAESSAFGLIALLVARFGSVEVAAHQIALNFSSLVFMLPLSLGLALLTRVGQALGAGDAAQARFRSRVGVGMALGLAVLSALGIAALRGPIAAAYTSDAQVAAAAATLLGLAALFQVSDAAQVSLSCAIRGYKVTRAPMLIHLTAFWLVALPLGCVLGLAPSWFPGAPALPLRAQGFWWALVAGLSVAAVGLGLLLQRVTRAALPAPPLEPKAHV